MTINDKNILIINTGGTFNKIYNQLNGSLEIYKKNKAIEKILIVSKIQVNSNLSLNESIINEKSNNLIESAKQLLEKNLVIPEYQRAYTWDSENIYKMIDDFNEFIKSDYKEETYYLGTILLHKDTEKYHIIDGQQRITTLLLMLKIINNPNFKDIVYDNPKSQYRIVENYKILKELQEDKRNVINEIYEKIRYTK